MEILSPTLLLDESIARRNIKRMVEKAKKSNVELKPHFKTHQSHIVGRWFKEEGVTAITVSSVSMAEYFAADGWNNITIAFPVNILEINKIGDLAPSVGLTLLVTDIRQVKELLTKVDKDINVLIEIDCGSNRSGLNPYDDHTINELITLLNGTQHRFKGFYSHFGHTYNASSSGDVMKIYKDSITLLTDLQYKYAYAKPTISIGDTPSCSIINDFNGISSIHAGNFVFYDLTQAQIGVCKSSDIAIALACPVVSKNTERQEVIIYGGGVHLSKEVLVDIDLNDSIYGRIVQVGADGWSAPLTGCYVRSISQEHGVVKLTKAVFDMIAIGDVIGVLPVHSCMTADVMGSYKQLSGEEIDHFKLSWVNN
jgi:D-serine deaminase-like pyridoxal phosphate-dependent protein